MIRNFLLYGIRLNIRGFGKMSRLLYPFGIVCNNKFGVRFKLDPYEKIDNCVIRYGYFDEDVIEALRLHMRPGDVFWDIGANIGLHAITIKNLLPDISCHCFEPYYPNFAKLIEHVRMNKANILCHNFALYHESGVCELKTTPGNHGATGLLADSGTELTGFQIATLSAQEQIDLGVLTAPSIIKLDTEGSEFHILKDLEKTIRKGTVHTIIFESNADYERISAYLVSHGYEVSRLSEAPNYCATLKQE